MYEIIANLLKESKKTTKQKITNTSAAGLAFVYDLENAPATNKIEFIKRV